MHVGKLFTLQSNKIYKSPNPKNGMRKEGRLLLIIILLIFTTNFILSESINDNLHLNIQAINSSGDVLTGTFPFEFNISTTSDCANVVYTNSTTLTTDSRGIISYYLENTGLNYSDQYWLCYYRNGTLINASKIAQNPYTFYANNSKNWIGLSNFNSTQMENSGGVLNILVSWLQSLFYTKSEVDTNITFVDDRVDSVNFSLLNINNTLEGKIIIVNNSLYFINYSLTGQIISVNNSFLSLNNSFDSRINSINTTANIGNLYNATASMIANLSTGQYQAVTNATINSINTTANIQSLINNTNVGFLQVNTTNLIVTGGINATGNISTSSYFKGQPITGMFGSGIIWANGTNNYAEVNINCTGITCSWSSFKVRLVNTSNDEKYCDIPAGTTTLTNNQQSVLYVDNNCNIQETSIQTFIATPLSPGGIADFANIIAENGNTYDVNGLGLENKRMIKLRKLLLEAMHLDVLSGLDKQQNTFPQFNITSGRYVYLMDVINTSHINTGINEIESIYHTSATNWASSDSTALNITWCDTGTSTALCTNVNRYRRVFIFLVGYNDGTTDTTGLHQLLPSQSITYSTAGECLDTVAFPLTYTLPSFYQYGGVMLYAYCARPSDVSWSSNWIDLRAVKQSTATGGVDTAIFLTKDGTTPLTGNWQIGNFNIINISTAQGSIGNFTTIFSGNRNVSADLISINTTANIGNLYNVTASMIANLSIVQFNSTIINNAVWNQSGTNVFLNNIGNNVGIGTTSPDSKLQVEGSTDGTSRIRANRTGAINGTTILGYDYLGTFSDNSLRIFTNSTQKVTIDSSGRVGIGTASPSSPLTINGSGSLLRLESSTNPSYLILNSSAAGGLTYTINPFRTGTSNTGFEIRDTTAGASRLSIDGNGNVGIGTTSPTQKLHIEGNVNVTKNLSVGSALIFTDTGGNMVFQI